jgi:hypothetical protein
MLCIKHNEDGRFARSPVGLRGKILKKAQKNRVSSFKFLVSSGKRAKWPHLFRRREDEIV